MIHDYLLVIYQQPGDLQLQAIYFDNKGQIIHFTLSFPAKQPGVVSESEASQISPRARLAYEGTEDNNTLVTEFSVGRGRQTAVACQRHGDTRFIKNDRKMEAIANMIAPIPDYKNLDLSGEVIQAAARMEARAQEAASAEMFQQLVAPLLTPECRTVFEFGCGTAALSRRIARQTKQAVVLASDKSAGMLKAAKSLIDGESLPNIRLEQWDVLDEANFPFPSEQFDLIISSVVVPYLDDVQTTGLIKRLAARLASGGTLAFVEQDLATDTLNYPKYELLRRTLASDLRNMKPTLALGLRPIMREAGLQVLPRRSFLWTDDSYGTYTRDLLERFADAGSEQGRITPEERDQWKKTLEQLARAGDFYYGIVYHLIAGRHE